MIKRIKITDFKSIRSLDMELGDVTVIIGRSGTGKSNFVQAIRFLRNVLLDVEKAVNFEWGWDRITPVGVAEPKTSIEVTFSVPGDDKAYVYAIGFGKNASGSFERLAAERLDYGEEVVFSRVAVPNRHGHSSWEWRQEPKTATGHYNSNRPVLGAMPSDQRAVNAYAALTQTVGYYHFPASALALLRQAEHGQEFLNTLPGLADNASNYREIMRAIIQDFRRPEIRRRIAASLQKVNESIALVELDSLLSPQKAIVTHTNGLQFALEQESDGVRRFYAHLLALYQSPSKLTMVFEEPENAIFPGALALLADEFKAAPREHRGQVIITTHSPILLDHMDVEDIRVAEMKNGATIIGRVSQEQREAVRDHLLRTGELLTVDTPKVEQAA